VSSLHEGKSGWKHTSIQKLGWFYLFLEALESNKWFFCFYNNTVKLRYIQILHMQLEKIILISYEGSNLKLKVMQPREISKEKDFNNSRTS